MSVQSEKDRLRQSARQARQTQPDRERTSEVICQRLNEIESFQNAVTVLWYVGARDEVSTIECISHQLQDQTDCLGPTRNHKRVIVPYCEGDDLCLFELLAVDELRPGAFGIREPAVELRGTPARILDPSAIDFVVVPGLAFDLSGRRLGYGRGFYDRMLSHLRPEVDKAGLLFERQIVERVPTDDHDVQMDWLVTETRLLRCR
ncbi:5-formyltetrahydrofolate cyclo-ligase [Roseiconus lacunae]|uniref:5-formyltetrahydrofolate cyclo-ligase n=1 Tax=Roseiconus lacunae TaxID=2605694 RepID=UPI001E36C324|nr:5-formyltetrahydrofolate cyclo-ligase [Roseiconus lacunae]MCD0458720.1 5-formyltetrahydrofolate cyclo-ligase [Roseiconus lacunae]